MRRAWEGFAESNPMYYIHSTRREWDPEDFFATGREQMAAVMSRVGDRVARGRMLEIGCGLGRVAVAAAEYFDTVVGVDISEAMVRQAREFDPPANVTFQQVDGSRLNGLDADSFDFVVSFSVFQHIADAEVLESYVAEVARVIAPAGKALLHFNTLPDSRLRRLVFLLPDPLLPKANRRYMRRYRRDPQWVRGLAARAGLAVEQEWDPATELHHLLLAPTA
jgi:SAM-dependent methyltransferase